MSSTLLVNRIARLSRFCWHKTWIGSTRIKIQMNDLSSRKTQDGRTWVGFPKLNRDSWSFDGSYGSNPSSEEARKWYTLKEEVEWGEQVTVRIHSSIDGLRLKSILVQRGTIVNKFRWKFGDEAPIKDGDALSKKHAYKRGTGWSMERVDLTFGK